MKLTEQYIDFVNLDELDKGELEKDMTHLKFLEENKYSEPCLDIISKIVETARPDSQLANFLKGFYNGIERN